MPSNGGQSYFMYTSSCSVAGSPALAPAAVTLPVKMGAGPLHTLWKVKVRFLRSLVFSPVVPGADAILAG